MFGQSLSNLTLTKPRMQGKNGQREYFVGYCKKLFFTLTQTIFSKWGSNPNIKSESIIVAM
jgi:hypothetical protein